MVYSRLFICAFDLCFHTYVCMLYLSIFKEAFTSLNKLKLKTSHIIFNLFVKYSAQGHGTKVLDIKDFPHFIRLLLHRNSKVIFLIRI